MTTYRTRVRSPWPADKAFDYLSDMARFDEWDPGTKSAALVTGTAGTVGATGLADKLDGHIVSS